MTNEEKILEHLQQSSKPDADKKDKRAIMDVRTLDHIRRLTTRIEALKEQSNAQNTQITALQDLLRAKQADILMLETAINPIQPVK